MKTTAFLTLAAIPAASSYAFVSSSNRSAIQTVAARQTTHSKSSLSMVDQNVLMGAGVAIAGLGVGIALVVFTENQGERASARGGGLSDSMATNLAGQMMEDVEVSSVGDLGSLTSQLENALKQSGGVDDGKMQELELTEAEKKKIAEDLDDGW
mmetsp:Transcript_28025/g.42950  ORF Transcript_28025/g.42950 Transcript_28025/m.42950 type:complete len:154 (-) Transcript_28025:282-743(-)|eukprot:CAMPEP_0194083510 /NCGR_PEP_ID=MMETSP0149-20130528/9468_1 /TAXON_ID=122233 /ORGANISM="Chaetoceros debilis, Strain MM31A-1" /LENGTH=153 /DNA_ID=CAMNT_0038765937 /DNA_START=73 /DNA_END=534 /DNA_ORIENTATION=-